MKFDLVLAIKSQRVKFKIANLGQNKKDSLKVLVVMMIKLYIFIIDIVIQVKYF